MSPRMAYPLTICVCIFHRNVTTVRQMLESKRNVSESAPPSFQTPVNTGNVLQHRNTFSQELKALVLFYDMLLRFRGTKKLSILV